MSKYSMLLKRSYGVENKIQIHLNGTITGNICEYCISIENRQGFCFTTNCTSFEQMIPFSPKYNIRFSVGEYNIPGLIPYF